MFIIIVIIITITLEKAFWFTFHETYVHTIFATSRIKNIDSKGPYISTSQTEIRNVCHLSVCSASTAYINLCKDLECLLEIQYFIKNYPYVARFVIFKTHCLGRSKTLSYFKGPKMVNGPLLALASVH